MTPVFDFNLYNLKAITVCIDSSQYTFLNAPTTMSGVFTFTAIPAFQANKLQQIIIMDSANIVYTREYDGETQTYTSWINTIGAAPANPWTWVSGANTLGQAGNYGTKGVPSTNNIPGARFGSYSWVDMNEIVWLFAGAGIDSTDTYVGLQDIWSYDQSSNIWTWVGGVDTAGGIGIYGTIHVGAPDNIPGSRASGASWTDRTGGIFWLFGGVGYDSVSIDHFLNDLWTFNAVTNVWAWQGGSSVGDQPGVYGTKGVPSTSNIPGGRQNPQLVFDATTNLVWIFGGFGYDSALGEDSMNDLWKLDLNTFPSLQWTWVAGSNLIADPGHFGTKGIPSINNVPSARNSGVTWIDASGNFWLFGGQGYDSVSANGYLNDLWKFNPTNSNWTWVSGADIGNQPGVYGIKGIPSTGNIPGARSNSISWIDASGNFWLFGGQGYDINGLLSDLNDIWMFNPATGYWTWIGGSDIGNQPGVYGTKGVPSTSNIPGGRDSGVSWTDASGNFSLFGGQTFAGPPSGLLNDLWKFEFL